MIINSSQVGMASERTYSSYSSSIVAASIETSGRKDAATIEFSKDGKAMAEQLKERQQEMLKQQEEAMKQAMRERAGAGRTQNNQGVREMTPQEEFKVELLRKMLEAMRQMSRGGLKGSGSLLRDLKGFQRQMRQNPIAVGNFGPSGGGTRPSGNVWTRTTITSNFFAEQENTAFTTTGLVKTADGREISFNVTMEMSRTFAQQNETLTQQEYVLTDPLVINMGSDIGSVTDWKFMFDIDADGKEDEVSFAGEGSGFLALDKNDDGKINDGSELFGTKSGDGFKDLAVYDEDGNGWIDEADSVFKDLKVWTKDENGNDQLMSLKDADVGAIYLGSVGTEFSLNDPETNKTNGVIRSTGIYLKESSGEAKTVQHIDLAV